MEVAMETGKHCWEKFRKLDIPNLPDYYTAQSPPHLAGVSVVRTKPLRALQSPY